MELAQLEELKSPYHQNSKLTKKLMPGFDIVEVILLSFHLLVVVKPTPKSHVEMDSIAIQ
jgi:hypothetical protein